MSRPVLDVCVPSINDKSPMMLSCFIIIQHVKPSCKMNKVQGRGDRKLRIRKTGALALEEVVGRKGLMTLPSHYFCPTSNNEYVSSHVPKGNQMLHLTSSTIHKLLVANSDLSCGRTAKAECLQNKLEPLRLGGD